MLISALDIKIKFDALLNESESRESISDFAKRAMQADDEGSLILDISNREKIWNAILYFSGVDIQEWPGVYIHTIQDFKEARRRIGI